MYDFFQCWWKKRRFWNLDESPEWNTLDRISSCIQDFSLDMYMVIPDKKLWNRWLNKWLIKCTSHLLKYWFKQSCQFNWIFGQLIWWDYALNSFSIFNELRENKFGRNGLMEWSCKTYKYLVKWKGKLNFTIFTYIVRCELWVYIHIFNRFDFSNI